jgi:hypothetical protein
VTFTVRFSMPDGSSQELHGMDRAFTRAVRDWWHDDIEGHTAVEIVDEDVQSELDAVALLAALERRH